MYKIPSQIFDESKIQLQFLNNDTLFTNKFLDLDFNGDNSPTFGESRTTYYPDVFGAFIENIKSGTQDVFMFDSDNNDLGQDGLFAMDGIFYHNGQTSNSDVHDMEKLIFTNCYGKNMVSIHLDLTLCKDIVVADLLTLKENMESLIIQRLKYLENLEDNNDDEKK